MLQHGRRRRCCSSTRSKGRCRRRASCCSKAFEHGLQPIVVINKIDRPDARAARGARRGVRPVRRARRRRRAARLPGRLRAPGATGYAMHEPDGRATRTSRPLFDMILEHVPGAAVRRRRRRCRSRSRTLDYTDFVGRIAIGRICARHAARRRRASRCATATARARTSTSSSAVLVRGPRAQGRRAKSQAGDIVRGRGHRRRRHRRHAAPTSTIRSRCRAITIDEPTISMVFDVNDVAVRRPARASSSRSRQISRAPGARAAAATSRCASRTRRTTTPSRSRAAACCTSAS